MIEDPNYAKEFKEELETRKIVHGLIGKGHSAEEIQAILRKDIRLDLIAPEVLVPPEAKDSLESEEFAETATLTILLPKEITEAPKNYSKILCFMELQRKWLELTYKHLRNAIYDLGIVLIAVIIGCALICR